jgi:predicted phosphodiesterase
LEGKLPDRWWRDPALLRAQYRLHGTLEAAADAGGVSYKTVLMWWKKHGLPKLPSGPRALTVVKSGGDEWLITLVKRMGDTATVEELADLANVAPKVVREALPRLADAGYRIAESGSSVRLERQAIPTDETHRASAALFDGDHVRFGIVSDTHLGSKAERLDAIAAAYDTFQQEGVRAVYHVGDLVDGYGIYKSQNIEVFLHTYEDQVDYATAGWPKRDGIQTFLIGGNHDLEGEFGRAGADPAQAVCNRRDDITYLGRYSAWVELENGARMHLLHPMGGASYAMSYRPQKIVEGYDLGGKPNILAIGHWHRAGYFSVRGVQTLLAGTFQGPTTYSVRKAFGEPGFGFWLIDCRLADDGSVVRFRPEFMPVYAGRTVN